MRKVLIILCLGLAMFVGFRKKASKAVEAVLPAQALTCGSSHQLPLLSDLKKTEKHQERDLSVESLRQKWKIEEHHQLEASEFKSPLGKVLVYSISQGNIPIVGMQIRVRIGLDGSILEEESNYVPIPQIQVDDKKVDEQIRYLESRDRGRFRFDKLNSESLVIFKRPNLPIGELAVSSQAIDTFRQEGKVIQLLLRLSDGTVLFKTNGRSEFES